MSDDEDQQEFDLSVIRKAIEISGNLIEQILKGIHYGSPEVRCLLYSECDYILECKVCRNLFRSLPNFVAHKRAYCTVAFQESDTFLNLVKPDEETVVVHPEMPEETKKQKNKNPRSLETTVQQLKDGTLGHSAAYKFYSQAADKIEQQREASKTRTLTFEPIPNTTKAMKVTVTNGIPTPIESIPSESVGASTDSIKGEENEDQSASPLQSSPTATLKSMLLKSALEGSSPPSTSNPKPVVKASRKPHPILSPPKKMTLRCKEGINSMPWKKGRNEKNSSPENANGMDFNTLECLQCNAAFRSKKTLLIHYQNAHLGKRTFFPCPDCDSVFFYIFGLTRHLLKAHDKTKQQIDKMREKLKKNSFVKQVTSTCQMARQQILHVKNEAEKEDTKLQSTADNNTKSVKNQPATISGGSRSSKSETSDIIAQSEFFNSSPREEQDYVCSNCDRSFGKKLNLLNHRKICLTQGCDMTNNSTPPVKASPSPTKSAATLISPKEKTDAVIKSRKSPSPTKSAGTLISPKEKTDAVIKSRKSEPIQSKKPLLKKTKTSGKTRNFTFSSRIASPRIEMSELIHSGFSSSHEDDPTDLSQESAGLSMVSHDKNTTQNSQDHDQQSQQRRSKNVDEHSVNEKEDKSGKETSEVKKEASPQIIPQTAGVIEEIWVDKIPGQPTEKIKSNRTYVLSNEFHKLECQDTKRIREIVNENELQCKHCDQEFSNMSNLRRHAIRHLGWKRYKCKMCKFSSYNKSECNTHLYRTHSDRFRNVSSVNSLIVDLGKEGSRARLRKKQQTIIEKQAAEEAQMGEDVYIHERSVKRSRKKDSSADESKVSSPIRKKPREEKGIAAIPFNISTRNSPREFDIRPYKKVDQMASLCTRKSSYPKKITVNSNCHDESDDDSKSTISQSSQVSSKSSKADSQTSFYSAKSKIGDSKMEISETDSEICFKSQNKTSKTVIVGPSESPQTRRSVRSSNSEVNDSKASRNITPELLDKPESN